METEKEEIPEYIQKLKAKAAAFRTELERREKAIGLLTEIELDLAEECEKKLKECKENEEATKGIEKFYEKHGENITIRCCPTISFVISPVLSYRKTCIRGQFTPSWGIADSLKRRLGCTQQEAEAWFDRFMQNTALALSPDALAVDDICPDNIEKVQKFFRKRKTKAICRSAQEYIDCILLNTY